MSPTGTCRYGMETAPVGAALPGKRNPVSELTVFQAMGLTAVEEAQAERDAANGEPGEQDNVHTDGTLPGVGQSLTLTGGRGLSSGHRGPPNQWVSRWPAIPATIRAMPAS